MSDPTMTDVKIPGTDWMNDYDTGGSTFVPPPQAMVPGTNGRNRYVEYQVQAPSFDKIHLKDKDEKWLTTKDGYLKAVIEGVKLVESGYELRDCQIGTAQYRKYGKDKKPTGELRNASPALDYLHAFGIDTQPGSKEDYESYFGATADRLAQVTIQWTAWDNDAKASVAEKWEDFPMIDLNNADQVETFKRLYPNQDPTGARLPFIEKNGKRFWARAEVKRWVSALPDKE